MMKAQMKENQGKSKGGKVCTCKACQKGNCGRCTKCNDMISFGGEKEDTSVTCLQRQCLNSKDVTLDGEDEEILEGVDWVDQVRWEGRCVKVEGGFCYESAVLEVEGGMEHRLKPGDFLLVKPDREEDRSVRHYPARVVFLKKGGGDEENTVHVQWLARGNDTVLGNTSDPREFFLTRECENVLISDVSKVLDLQRRAVVDFEAWRRQGGTEKAIAGSKAGGQDGWWRQLYIPEHGRFEYPQERDLTLGEGDFCRCCNDAKEEHEKAEVGWSKDGSWVRMGGTKFNKGDFIMIEDETLRYTVPKKEPQEFKKKKKDPALYPEDWRKPDIYKGDHVETFDPFQVVRLEEVREKDGYVRVRKLYRPHDTHMSVREARGKPYTYLYWSEEIGRLYTPAKAAQKDKPSMEAVVGRAWVKAKQGGTAEDLQDWTDEGEDRFFISQSYNADTKSFSPLYKAAVDAVNKTLSGCPALSLPSIKPLQCLDVFAGCGGLSQGLHQAGATTSRWAIEFWKPSADAFKKNNPDCTVINEDCNGLLEKAQKGDYSTGMPRQGQVDIMVGGPPCQGFSLLNIYKEKEYSKFKNSLISTYLSYCDFYRPRFYILENVRNLVANEGGMVLKLILSSLVRMGYQVGFNVLQAGHYGVSQTRRRLIVMAAAPGERLPLYPEPLHNFQGPHFQEIVLDGRSYSTTSKRPGAPRRALTCWDSISDLPPIPSGHDQISIPYQADPRSHLQRNFRKKANVLTDHITKPLNPLQQERINLIPTDPGADWRDLPNKRVTLEDGRQTRKLEYNYEKESKGRGVCNCATSTKRRLEHCDADDKQSDTIIAWSLPHTADRHNNWSGVYGRAPWDGIFKTTITDPEPLGKQGQVLHPEQNRLLSVREYARSQGFGDDFGFSGTIRDKHREIGNAVPPPLGKAIGLEIRKAVLRHEGKIPDLNEL